jgi:hypothetical protein
MEAANYMQKLEMIKKDPYSMSLVKNVAGKVLPLEEASYMIRDHFKGKFNSLETRGMVLTLSNIYRRPTEEVELEAHVGSAIRGYDERKEPQ